MPHRLHVIIEVQRVIERLFPDLKKPDKKILYCLEGLPDIFHSKIDLHPVTGRNNNGLLYLGELPLSGGCPLRA